MKHDHAPFARPTMTAAEKLMMLSCRAVCALFINHMLLRARMGQVDAGELERCAHQLGRIAHDVAREEGQ